MSQHVSNMYTNTLPILTSHTITEDMLSEAEEATEAKKAAEGKLSEAETVAKGKLREAEAAKPTKVWH